MNSPREQTERALGEKIEPLAEQQLPGLVPSSTAEVVYFQDDGRLSLYDQFDRLTEHIAPPLAKHGGVTTTKHTLRVPDGQLFHAIKYRGDVEGWRRQIAEGAKKLGVILGSIQNGSTFILSDGRAFVLSDCKHGTV
ncbi:hypothetical protein H8N03_14855 [Ramlibacter sp. USB13]|uniref:Uncharacterized protein n=1 Tax=Ramlibacter cellulosilyticus TaxID=2764187 RepID=A0A923MTA2_9BURK|nr:hypothetical protein [Ramlibacter cellulosilyticus]MBC5784229.1 hypothetical protein [Ramlibacter cellulosilyticus]